MFHMYVNALKVPPQVIWWVYRQLKWHIKVEEDVPCMQIQEHLKGILELFSEACNISKKKKGNRTGGFFLPFSLPLEHGKEDIQWKFCWILTGCWIASIYKISHDCMRVIKILTFCSHKSGKSGICGAPNCYLRMNTSVYKLSQTKLNMVSVKQCELIGLKYYSVL